MAARRIHRSAHEAGLETAVFVGEDDDNARWPAEMDYTLFLSSATPSAEEVVGLALDAGSDLLHPGWGPLVRESELASRTQMTGIQYVGPAPKLLALAADGALLRRLAAEVDIHVVPGSEPIDDLTAAEQWLSKAGYPASARRASDPDAPWMHLADAAEAQARLPTLLDDGPIVLERHVEGAREVEVLVVGDASGDAITVGERDTSAQPGGQRVLVETPMVGVPDAHALEIRTAAASLIARLRWVGLVSVRFLLAPDGRGYLLRLRPGLQPWHSVTEAVLGLDLVDTQLRLAQGERLGWEPHHFNESGHAICLRILSTSKTAATISALTLPADVRVDRGFEVGDTVRPGEDIFHLVAHAPTRQAAIVRARAALEKTRIEGPETNLPLFRRIFDLPEFWARPLNRDRIEALLD